MTWDPNIILNDYYNFVNTCLAWNQRPICPSSPQHLENSVEMSNALGLTSAQVYRIKFLKLVNTKRQYTENMSGWCSLYFPNMYLYLYLVPYEASFVMILGPWQYTISTSTLLQVHSIHLYIYMYPEAAPPAAAKPPLC